ncbi:MAG: dTDP-4-dehydrorhamnose reductase [Candidatus Firestonebacteria bacterium]
MKILLFGASGMLGYDILRIFGSSKYELFLTDLIPQTSEKFIKADIKNFDEVKKLFDVKPDIAINASAYTDVDGCENNIERAYSINAVGSWHIAVCCRELNIPLIHISTDYVFDGKKKEPYIEDDEVHPSGVYGRSKLAGEILVKGQISNFYILRTSLLYGKNRENFVTKIIQKAKNNEIISVPDDMIGSPTYTLDLAELIKKIIETGKYGLYHTANTGYCSRYEWAKKIVEIAGLKADIKPVKSNSIHSKAKRPLFSALKNHNLERIGISLRTWDDALEEFIKEQPPNPLY